jgi:hypothetical protein
VEEYCQAAARFLSPRGIFVCCEGCAGNSGRVEAAATKAGLVVLQTLSVYGKEGKPPLFAVYVMTPADERAVCAAQLPFEVTVRDAHGIRTSEYCKMLLEMGIPVVVEHVIK